MATERINVSTLPETNVDWLANGEKADETVLNRPMKQVATIVNLVMDDVDANAATALNDAVAMAIALG